MKLAIATAALTFSVLAAPAFAQGKPADPGFEGRTNGAINAGVLSGTRGAANSGKGLGLAADIFGDNGKGNGADPDAVGIAPDHDPGNVGGGPDTSR